MQNRLTQKRLTDGQAAQNAGEKPTLLNRLKNSIMQFFNRKDKPLGIDTAENNTRNDSDLNSSFNDFIDVSDEIKNNIVKTGQNMKLENQSAKKSNEIKTEKGESIVM